METNAQAREQADVKNQSFYAIALTLLVLLTVAVWQFFSLLARGEPYTAGGSDERSLKRPTFVSTPK
jgi:hypothetical protein